MEPKMREVERLRGVILESSQQATDALVALAADEHAWRLAIRVLASIAQREASSLATAVEGAACGARRGRRTDELS
jgi:hypothetical protein